MSICNRGRRGRLGALVVALAAGYLAVPNVSSGLFSLAPANGCLGYQGYVKALGAQNYWPLTESTGSSAQDLLGASAGSYANSPSLAQPTGPKFSPVSVAFGGPSSSHQVTTATSYTNPAPVTVMIWFQTTTAGGGMMSLANTQTGAPNNYDRMLYVGSDGKVYFAVYNGNTSAIASASTYTDGAWHFAVGTLGSAGQFLYVDSGGAMVSVSTNVTNGQNYTGYWRIGYYNPNGWTNGNGSFFTGNLVAAAVFPRQLSATEVGNIYKLATRCTY